MDQNHLSVSKICSLAANNEDNKKITQQDWEEGYQSFIQMLDQGIESKKIRALLFLGRIAKKIPTNILMQILPTITSLVRNHSETPQTPVHDPSVPRAISLVQRPETSPCILEISVFCLGRIASVEESLSARIGELGAIPVLLRIMRTHHEMRMKKGVLKALWRIVVYSKSNQEILERHGGVEGIAPMVTIGPGHFKELAAELLTALTNLKEVRRSVVNMGGAHLLVECCRIGKMASRARAARALGLLGVTRRVRRILVNADAIPALVELLRDGDMDAKHNAGNSLGIISAHVDYLSPVAEAGAIPLLIELLQGGDPRGREIAEDVFCVLAVVEENAMSIAEHLVRILRSSAGSEAKAAAADVIWDLSSYRHSVPVIRASGAIPVLVRALVDECDDVKEKASGAVAQLSYDRADRIALAEAGAVPALLSLLQSESEETKDNAAETLINFSEDPALRDSIAEAFSIPAFQHVQERLLRLRQTQELADDQMMHSLRSMTIERFTL